MRVNEDFREYYDIIQNIEEGFDSIYKAKIKNTNEMRAIKVYNKKIIKNILRSDLLREPTDEDLKPYIDCFLKEINNMKLCEGENNENKNAVKFYEYFDNKEEFAIVMELCDENMKAFLSKKKNNLDANQIYNIMNDLNNTFKIISQNKIIYRDLKLESILIKYNNKEKTNYTVKLKLNSSSNEMTKLTKLISSFTKKFQCNCLNAPEILKEKEYNEECDLWSLGIIIYVLFFRDYPYKGANEIVILEKIKKIGQKNLKKTENAEVDDLISKLLVEDPTKRMTWKEYFNHPFFGFRKYYEIENEICVSRYATIYKAKIKKTGEYRALKIFAKSTIIAEFINQYIRRPTEEEINLYIDNFYNEIKLMKIIQGNKKENKYTVKIYDSFETKEELVIVMELCDDNLLNFLANRNEAFKPEEVFNILNQLNTSFEIIVKNSLVHRALLLENILVKYKNKEKTDYTVKLKFTNESCLLKDLNKKRDLNINGNIKMLPPEILKGENYNEKSDLWNLGLIIYVLSFREYPYNDVNKMGILNKISISGQNILKKTNNKKLDDLISRLLIEDPNKRISWKEYFSFFKEQDFRKYYTTIKKIGEGSFGLVYEVIKNDTKEKRAVKLFDKHKINQQIVIDDLSNNNNEKLKKYINDLFKEMENMKIAMGKNNENINTVQFYEYFENENEFTIVMELCDENLLELITKKNEVFSAQEIREILLQLNNTFKIMNENKLAHRDLKMENILIKHEKNKKNIFKVADYGLSKQLINLSRYKTTAGTLRFMAPEIIKKEEYNEECDLWSLGVLIYVLCFIRYPYNANGEVGLLNQIINQGQQNFLKKGNIYLDDLISKLLVEDPNKRLNWKDYFIHPFFNKNKKNQILIKLNVSKKDLKNEKGVEFKNIYFLENDKEDSPHNKEINSDNCSLFINNNSEKFNKYFKPIKAGIYEIKIIFKNPIKDCSYMFNNCTNIISIDLSSFDSLYATNMSFMFNECTNLKEINLNYLNVSNVTDMSYMFAKCSELESIAFPESFNTQNLENMASMFYWCQKLKEISFSSSFNTSKVKNMKTLFGKCYNLKKLILIHFNTEEVKDMSSMFQNCNNLEEILINPSTFKTDKVTNMIYMFSECTSLKEIDMSSFNIENVKFSNYMFYNCKKLNSVNLSNSKINKEANMSHMFVLML